MTKVIVTANNYGHKFEIGETVTILSFNGTDYFVTNGLIEGWLDKNEIRTADKDADHSIILM